MSRFSAESSRRFPDQAWRFVFDSPAPLAHNGGMNEGNDTLNSSKRPGSEKKSDQKLSRSEKIISAGLIAAAAVLWGVYGPGVMKAYSIDKWLESSMLVAGLFLLCIACSCIILYACREEEYAKDGKGRDIAAGNAPEGGRADQGEPNDEDSSPRVWTKWHWAAVPWLIALPLLLTIGFQWQALLSGLWVGAALLLFCWPLLSRRAPVSHPAMEDKLGRGLLYSQFGDKIRILVEKVQEQGLTRNKGLSIAVTGEWGTGKSHFINAIVSSLEKKYEEPHKLHRETLPQYAYRGSFVTARVDLWQSSTVEGMWEDVARTLVSMLNERELVYDNFFKKILIGLLEFLPIRFTSLAEDAMRLISTGGFLTAESNKLVNRIEHSSKRYILVMENLDRCSKKKLRAAFSLIERLNQVAHLVVICSIANGEISTALNGKSHGVSSALLKIFDVQVPVPILMTEQAVNYRNELLDAVSMECPNFKSWFENQNFENVTPRVLQRITAQLSLIDNLYLLRHDNDRMFDVDWEGNSLAYDIFCFEALRAAHPELPFPYVGRDSEDANKPKYEAWKEYIKTSYSSIGQTFHGRNACELNTIVERLLEAPDEHMEYIARQEYLRISYLSDKECKKLLDSYNAGTSPQEAMVQAYGGAYNPMIENELIREVCQYCIGHPEHKSSFAYIETLCTPAPDFTLLPHYIVTNLIVLVQSDSAEHSRWQGCLQSIIRIYPVERLAEEVGKIVDYIGKDKERIEIRYELSSSLTRAAKDILDGYGRDGENSDRLSKVADQLLREYAKKACAFILDATSLNDYGKYRHLMIGQSVPQNIYDKKLEEGAQEFLNSADSEPYKNNLEEGARRLLRSIIIRSHDSEAQELTDMPFAVLSFAVIWSNLCRGLLVRWEHADGEIEIIDKHIVAIKKQLDMDAKNREAVGKSPDAVQLWANRREAMKILQETLEWMKKEVSKND